MGGYQLGGVATAMSKSNKLPTTSLVAKYFAHDQLEDTIWEYKNYMTTGDNKHKMNWLLKIKI